MAGSIISIINFKGGVGKTTIAVNVAATLAKKGKKTLLIDLDPQSNASVWLLGEAKWKNIAKPGNLKKTSFHLFQRKFDIESVVCPLENTIGDSIPNLHLLPATYHMVQLERAILRACDQKKIHDKYFDGYEYRFLADDVPLLKGEFDYVVIDCPPNLYYMTGNAVCNSDFIVTPVIPDSLSTIGLRLLLNELVRMIEPLLKKNSYRRPPTVLGVAISRLRQVKEHEIGLNSVKETLDQLKKTGHMLLHPCTGVLKEEALAEAIVHSEAVQNRKPICLYAPNHKANSEINILSDKLVGLMGVINEEH